MTDNQTNVPLLLPCPFCGGKPVAMFNSVVECRNCPSARYAGYPSADFQTWNRRAPEAARELTAAQGVERGLPTNRREKAVLLAIATGWQWDGQEWTKPPQPIEPQGAVVVTDAMVERAMNAWCDVADVDEWRVRNTPEALRAAIEAALPVAVGAGEDQDGKRYRYLVEANEIPEAVSLGLFMSNKEMTDFAIDSIFTTGEMQ